LGFILQPTFLEKIKVVNPSIIMVERIFKSFKPFFVKVMMECNTYCYIYHGRMDELDITLNNIKIALGPHDKGLAIASVCLFVLILIIHVVHLEGFTQG
jgi:hypothetical protein